MRSLGISIDVKAGQASLRAVVLSDRLPAAEAPSVADINVDDTFEVTAEMVDLASQLHELASTARGRARSLAPDVIVVRRADRPQRANNTEGPRQRLLAEGAVAAAVRECVVATSIRTGRECGAAFGGSKEQVLEAAGQLVTKAKLLDAAAAALSGLVASRA